VSFIVRLHSAFLSSNPTFPGLCGTFDVCPKLGGNISQINNKSMKIETIKELTIQFEEISNNQDGVEFWFARQLQTLLGYTQWRNFVPVIEKAKTACRNAGQEIEDHFAEVRKMVDIGSGSSREIDDVMLTRYACYLIAQNGDPRKEPVAFAMNYFAVQTRRHEVLEQRIKDWERLQAREKLTLSERELSGIIYQKGVDNAGFARIRSRGDHALFGGYSTQDMKRKLGVADTKPLADFLPTITIKAKDFATARVGWVERSETHHLRPICRGFPSGLTWCCSGKPRRLFPRRFKA
jgi:DNA-damage-inducible protein D